MFRKSHIADDMTKIGTTSSRGLAVVDRVNGWLGVLTSTLVGYHVGHDGGDAVVVVETYGWDHDQRGCKKWWLGFREKQEMCIKLRIVRSCPFDSPRSHEAERRQVLDDLLWPAPADLPDWQSTTGGT
jgi:hypothetical protein